MCHRNGINHFRKDNRMVSYSPNCMCWHCWECRKLLRRKWITHFTKVLEFCGLAIGVLTCPVDSWDSFSRNLRRLGIKHFKVKLRTAQYGVVIGSTVPIESLSLYAVTPMTAAAAIKRFTGWVNSIEDGRGGNPVSSSRSWCLPSDKPSGWQKIAVGPTVAELKAIAERTNVIFSERTINGTDMAVCRGETAAMDELCASLAELCPRIHSSPRKIEFEFNNDSDDADQEDDGWCTWKGQPDEEPSPYLVGPVT